MNRYQTQTWKDLETLQNYIVSVKNTPIDILTFTAFFNDEELIQHRNRYAARYPEAL